MQISFGRAIKVNTNLPLADNIFNRVNPAVRDVFDVMAGEDSTFLDEEKSEKVRDFLRRQIDDYSDKEGIIYRMVDENLFLFTGSDVRKVRNIDKDAIKTLKNAKTPQSKKEIKERKNSSLLNLIEDGLNYGKKYIELSINSKDKQNIATISVYKWPYEDDNLGVGVLDLNA